MTVDDLAAEIRRVDGNHFLGAGALAEALMPFLRAALTQPAAVEGGELRRLMDGWTQACARNDDPLQKDLMFLKAMELAYGVEKALPGLMAERDVLRRLAPEHFRWTGGPDQTEDPKWVCDKLKYGGAHFENIGTPDVRLVVYDDQDRRWVAERGDYIVKGERGLWVLPARAALGEQP